ncbi:SulP family inorganic anion transporter [Pseudonocardia sp. NPDC049154]|uniref:SulP family inorganic anion transporter n=1 Tax=Pseudonocardia sp. NPDC049154 TaxID=3155501 RepID=UPI0033DD4C4C
MARPTLRPPPGLAPGIDALRRRRWPALRGDLLGGPTVAAYLVPQVLAYAAVAGLPPVTGLWAAGAALAVYPLLGSSRLLSIGPESTTALLTAVAIAPVAGGDPGRYAALAAGLAPIVGVVCVIARIARLAFLADLLSRPVLVGYLAGIAVIMIISQLEPLTGVSVEGDGALQEVVSFATGLDQVHLPTLAVGLIVLALLGLGALLTPRAPVPMVAVLLAAGAVAVFGLDERGVATITLPRAALGALVVYAALRLIDVHEFRRIARFRRSELLLALATVAAVLALGVLYGVLAAVGLSLLDLVRRIARPHSAVLGFAPGVPGMHDVGDLPGTEQVTGLVVRRYDPPLFFANADDFRSSVLAASEDTESARWVLLDLEAVTELDVTAADMLCGLARELTGRGVVVAVARAKRELVEDLAAGGVLETIPRERLYPTLPTAVAAYRAATDGPARPPGPVPREGPPAA